MTCLHVFSKEIRGLNSVVGPSMIVPLQSQRILPTKRIHTLTRQLQTASHDRDFARKATITRELQAVASQFQIPLVHNAAVRVPYLTGNPTPAITRCINRLVGSMPVSRAQRQAVRARVVLVRIVPLNIRRAFKAHSNKSATLLGRPPCTCAASALSVWERAGTVQILDGHFCLIPVSVPHEDGILRSTDPLPCTGRKSHQATVSSLKTPATALHVRPLPDTFLASVLPPSLFLEDSSLRRHVQQVARDLSQHAVVRVVDKGPGLLWGFCRAWAWDALQPFLSNQEYSRENTSHQDILHTLLDSASACRWPVNKQARLALLYLIGRAKSRTKVEILWRPIAAASSPIVSRSRLRVAARAYTCFLRTLVAELPCAFLVLGLNDMGAWVKRLGSWSPERIGEADCKDQFNHIPPALVVQHMSEAAAWLKARRRWRATTLGWSVHKESGQLDRAGPAKKGTFQIMPMDELRDNVVLAAGELWRRGGAIPMGGSFSAQSVDLHCVWMCKKLVSLLRQMGAMSLSGDVVLQWQLPTSVSVALHQFRAYLMVAAKGPAARTAMHTVCQTVEGNWGLKVLCPCRDKDPSLICHGACMGCSVRCMGVSIYISPAALLLTRIQML